MRSQSSSTKSFLSSSWMSSPLPLTCKSKPSVFLSFWISARLLRKTEFFQSDFVTVLDMTYFVISLIPGQMSSCSGQKEAKISNVFLPKRRFAGFFCCSSRTLSTTSSKYGALQPPYLKSSSPPPGACMTPSNVINDETIIFLMGILLHEILEHAFYFVKIEIN